MRVNAHAKINLYLKIHGKRTDGYHELTTVMQSISLYDEIDIGVIPGGIEISSDRSEMPSDRANLMWRAAESFFERTGIQNGISIQIKKKIPIAAGLGGGSSDAAAILKSLNYLHGGILSDPELHLLAQNLGSDVPFFIHGGTAIARGRGERIERIRFPGRMTVLLINPGFPVSTAEIYRHMRLMLTSGERTLSITTAFSAEAFRNGSIFGRMHNDLEDTVLDRYPEISRVKRFLMDAGASASMVSGSGGTVFGIFTEEAQAASAAELAEGLFPWVTLADTIEVVD